MIRQWIKNRREAREAATESRIAAEVDRRLENLKWEMEQRGGLKPYYRAEIKRLQEQVRELRRVLTYTNEENHRKNLMLDAAHYVWCDGGCAGGIHRWTPGPLTQETVDCAVRQTERLKRKWGNLEAKRARELAGK